MQSLISSNKRRTNDKSGFPSPKAISVEYSISTALPLKNTNKPHPLGVPSDSLTVDNQNKNVEATV